MDDNMAFAGSTTKIEIDFMDSFSPSRSPSCLPEDHSCDSPWSIGGFDAFLYKPVPAFKLAESIDMQTMAENGDIGTRKFPKFTSVVWRSSNEDDHDDIDKSAQVIKRSCLGDCDDRRITPVHSSATDIGNGYQKIVNDPILWPQSPEQSYTSESKKPNRGDCDAMKEERIVEEIVDIMKGNNLCKPSFNEFPALNQTRKRSRKDGPKRPPNAFMLYRRFHQARLKIRVEEYLELYGMNFNNNIMSKVLGILWKRECDEVKCHFHELANTLAAISN